MGDYHVLEHLGHGSYGIVDKVLHRETGKIFALKEIRGVFRTSY